MLRIGMLTSGGDCQALNAAMRGVDKAVRRIRKAVDGGERILVYGDYDVDGVTAVALVFQALNRIVEANGRLGFYVPDRFNEGYGISRQGVDYAHQNGFTLVIALDCGIKAVDRMRDARKMGIDFIICDHHVAGDELPDVVACLDAVDRTRLSRKARPRPATA